jgi:hypothetical protein
MTTSLKIGDNCSFSLGANTLLKTRTFACHSNAFLSGTVRTIIVNSTGVIGGDGTIYHSFSRTGEASRSTITPTVTQINIDLDDGELDYHGIYHRSFENGMIHTFDVLGPLAVFAMGMPFILLKPEINKDIYGKTP